MSEPYSKSLIAGAKSIAAAKGISCTKGYM